MQLDLTPSMVEALMDELTQLHESITPNEVEDDPGFADHFQALERILAQMKEKLG